MSELATLSALDAAAKVRSGEVSARAVVEATLARIAALNPKLGAFTDVTAERALAKAAALDAAKARGETLGPLAGATFAVKNLFDVRGLPTRAGSKINRERAPASADATLITRLEAAGAILVGALNMGEYAYDFTGENAHDGPSRNPHDLGCMSGGSSGGSGSAVGGGLAPLALGSDTNGSIRVPSALCGIFGLKPTYGRLSRARSFPFVSSFDHLGPFARSVGDLAAAYDAMQGADPDDPGQTPRGFEPTLAALGQGAAGLRIATLGGYFAKGAEPAVFEGLERVARALGADRVVELPEAGRARAAAFLITMAEGGALHLDRLRTRAADYDPDTRDRLIAGALLPAAWVVKAQKLRRWFRAQALEVFKQVDVLLAPATPVRAPALGQKTFTLDGVEIPVRANLGLFTQPISFIGLPVVAVPLWRPGSFLPTGVQVIAPPWREDLALRVAAQLEREGVCRAPIGRAAEA
jgi:aspartyl-tRNA(Asn)/glutamyl-tRNA(Gln) amidotransferase subunit A